jgi:adenosylcobinamide kinase / adenosylcobinamide-phosphate guanylyltransferase
VKNLTFITGAVRSGKSLFAEELAGKSKRAVYYLATMQILEEDPEQLRRLELHRRRRPAEWKTVDSAFKAHEIVEGLAGADSFVIFDCLSLYVTNILIETGSSDAGGPEPDPYLKEDEVMSAVELLLTSIESRPEIEFVIVSNEAGWGVVPETKLGRAFRDFLGIANQMVAARSESVYLCCSGLRVQLK